MRRARCSFMVLTFIPINPESHHDVFLPVFAIVASLRLLAPPRLILPTDERLVAVRSANTSSLSEMPPGNQVPALLLGLAPCSLLFAGVRVYMYLRLVGVPLPPRVNSQLDHLTSFHDVFVIVRDKRLAGVAVAHGGLAFNDAP